MGKFKEVKEVPKPCPLVQQHGCRLCTRRSYICLCCTSAYVGKRAIGKSPAPCLKEKMPGLENTSGHEIDLPGAKVGEESSEFVENVLKDIETLGVKYDVVTYTSDYFPKLMEMAECLIKQGKAYVDDTPKDNMNTERRDGVESKCRNNTVEENLLLWSEMVNGTKRGTQCCVRGKFDMQDPNKSLRDPVYYRCNPDPHHRVGSKYKVYPTYDFACPFVDALQGVTHALRSSEYHDRNAQYYRILQDMGLRRVEIFEFSRLNMVYTVLSKHTLRWFVQNKKVEDWTDARFPTVQGILRRGLKIEALIQFILEQGASKNLNLMEWDKLWTINKKIIDPVCGRHTAVLKDKSVPLTLTNGPEVPFIRILPRHKKFEGAGYKAITFANRIWLEYADASAISVGEEVTLMDWGNAIIKEIKTDDGTITQLVGELHPDGSVKMTKLKLTWLSDTEDLVSNWEKMISPEVRSSLKILTHSPDEKL
uniref:Glutamyl-tRNA synthetase n=1 Tax=Aegilops tauschii subsp. strangulata TaxID=200361 RepID=A0A452ZLB9_AEGTS